MPHAWRKNIDLPGLRGMLSASDPRNVPSDRALILHNADFGDTYGGIVKTPGFDLHGVSPTPFEMSPILSAGFFTYTLAQEEPGVVAIVTNKMGRLIVQCLGVETDEENGFDWWYRDYDFEVGEWAGWVGPLNEDYIFGTTVADKIRWTRFPTAMRGACGAFSDSNPLWVGYIRRLASEDNGYFHNYTYIDAGSPTTGDAEEFNDVVITQSIPNVHVGMELQYWENFGLPSGSYKREKIMLLVVPVFDGHQVAGYDNYTDAYAAVRKYLIMNTGEFEENRGFNVRLQLKWNVLSGFNKPARLTGLNIYESRADLIEPGGVQFPASPLFSSWQLIRNIDIREGNSQPIRGFNTRYLSAGGPSSVPVLRVQTLLETDSYNGCWVEIETSDTDKERYRIEDVYNDETYGYFEFTPSDDTNLDNDTVYDIAITERWYTEEGVSVPEIVMVLDGNWNLGNAPPWLPDPNKISDETYDPPDVTPNYKHSIFFEGAHIVGNFYDKQRDELRPLTMAESQASGSRYGGHDTIYLFTEVHGEVGDEIMGFAAVLNILSVFTKQGIFRYIRHENISVLQEIVYPVGLVSSDSLAVYGKRIYFKGRKDKKISYFFYDGINEPVAIGDDILPEIKAALGEDGVVEDQTVGWIDNALNQYRTSINRYES